MKNYTVDLYPSKEKVEPYEEKDENVLMVRVQLPTGEIIEGNGYRVELALSKDAMLALGTALIRAASVGDEEMNFWHLHPSIPELVSQDFGVFLHPKSCELLIAEKNIGNIHKIVSDTFSNE